jgi:hypothetical protein
MLVFFCPLPQPPPAQHKKCGGEIHSTLAMHITPQETDGGLAYLSTSQKTGFFIFLRNQDRSNKIITACTFPKKLLTFLNKQPVSFFC